MLGVVGRGLFLGVLLSSVGGPGCSAYDPALLERETSTLEVEGASTPDAGSAADAPDASPRPPDADIVIARPHVCGDGRVSGEELCDTGITAEQPGACPPELCLPLSECALRARRGTGCQSACVLLPEACIDGDGCCPGACDGQSDSDCSRHCGDGQVQPNEETCEDGTDTPCPAPADCDDGDPCTEDLLLGSAENCNAKCAHDPITTLVGGDACCPEGANANSDPDCVAECGNMVREGDEECDGTPGCSEQCVVRETPEQLDCLERFADDACLRCACLACTEPVFGCYESGDPARDAGCGAINRCARESDCVGSPCYCGTSSTCLRPDGPCVNEIHAAASSPTPPGVQADAMDSDSAIGRAVLLGQCAVTQCSDVCP